MQCCPPSPGHGSLSWPFPHPMCRTLPRAQRLQDPATYRKAINCQGTLMSCKLDVCSSNQQATAVHVSFLAASIDQKCKDVHCIGPYRSHELSMHLQDVQWVFSVLIAAPLDVPATSRVGGASRRKEPSCARRQPCPLAAAHDSLLAPCAHMSDEGRHAAHIQSLNAFLHIGETSQST